MAADKKKQQLPMTIFIGPTGGGREKVEHERCLIEIVDRYKDGRPRMMELIPLDAEIECGKEHTYIAAYIPRAYLEREV